MEEEGGFEQDISWWPREGDRLFRPGTASKDVVRLDFESIGKYFIAGAYKYAADIIVSHVSKTTCGGQDSLVFPIVFAYRQYIELRLKEIIKHGRRSSERIRIHNLEVLWNLARTFIEQRYSEVGSKRLEFVESRILEFAAIDPRSTLFRYAEDPPTVIIGIQQVDLANLGEVMERLAEFLDEVEIALSNGEPFLPTIEYAYEQWEEASP